MNLLIQTIKSLRQQKGWNQRDIAEKLELSVPAYSKIETGFTELNLPRLEQIAKVFEMSVIQLLGCGEPEGEATLIEEVEMLRKKLATREEEIIDLQKKVIELLEEVTKHEHTIHSRDISQKKNVEYHYVVK